MNNLAEELPAAEEEEPEYGGGDDDGSDPAALYDGETYLYPSRREVCQEFGLIGMTCRDGFVYVYTIHDGEQLFSDFLKKRGKATVSRVK